MNMRVDLDSQRDKIFDLLQSGMSRSQVCVVFQCRYSTLASRLTKWGITLKNQGRKGFSKKRKSVQDFLKKRGPFITSHNLKLRLWREGIKPQHCEKCGWSKLSVDGRLPLELDHIDGDRFNHELTNLQILCPNCHALKPGNSGAAKSRRCDGTEDMLLLESSA